MKFKSVGNQILLVLVLTIMLVSLTYGIILRTVEKRRIIESMSLSIDSIGNRLSNALVIPIWNFDQTQIENIIRLEMVDRNIHSILLLDEYDKPTNHLYYAGSNGDIKKAEQSDSSKDEHILISGRFDITRDSSVIGKVYVAFGDREYIRVLAGITIQVVIQVFILIVITSIISFFLFKIVLTNPLKRMLHLIADLADGDGDLTKKIPVTTIDELGQLGGNINKFTEKLSFIIGKLVVITEKSYSIGNTVAVNAQELSATINEISATVQSMKTENSKLNDAIAGSTSLLSEVKQFIDYLKGEINAEADIISAASVAIEETLGEIKNANKLSHEKMELSKRLVSTATVSEDSMKNTVSSIKNISASINFIMDLIKIINNVASQTNLLAMNAAIEAAHAGESGKGFAVVADEIRSLAETTGENAKNINVSLKDIIGKIENTVKTTESTGLLMSNMISEISALDNGISELLATFETVNSRSEDVSRRLKDLVSKSDNIDASSDKTRQSIYDITDKFKNASNLSAENLAGMSEIANGMSEIARSVLSLSDLGNENAVNIVELEQQIKKFKI